MGIDETRGGLQWLLDGLFVRYFVPLVIEHYDYGIGRRSELLGVAGGYKWSQVVKFNSECRSHYRDTFRSWTTRGNWAGTHPDFSVIRDLNPPNGDYGRRNICQFYFHPVF